MGLAPLPSLSPQRGHSWRKCCATQPCLVTSVGSSRLTVDARPSLLWSISSIWGTVARRPVGLGDCCHHADDHVVGLQGYYIYIYIHYVLPRKIPINAVIFLFVWLVAAWVIPNAVISLGSFCWRIRANIGSGGDVRWWTSMTYIYIYHSNLKLFTLRICLFFASWELTYPVEKQYWRWVMDSFPGG